MNKGLLLLVALAFAVSSNCDTMTTPAYDSSWLMITTPTKNENLWGMKNVSIAWENWLGENYTYSVAISEDGKRFDGFLAKGLKTCNYLWNLDENMQSRMWIKVSAIDKKGNIAVESVLPVEFRPAKNQSNQNTDSVDGTDALRPEIPQTCVVISYKNQKVFYFENGKLIHVFTCSSARYPRWDSQPGTYRVFSRERNHMSRIYDVEMPYSLFYDGNRAIHATKVIRLLGRPASHGCVRLHPRDAKKLYYDVSVGTPVIVLPRNTDWSPLINAYKSAKKLPVFLGNISI